MATKLIDLGMKRKELNPGESACAEPASCKDWENQKVYPELCARGKQAEMLGAEDLEEGDVVRQEVVWKVSRRRKVEENGKTDYTLDLQMLKASDLIPEGKAESDDDEPEMESDDSESPAMAYIQGRAAKE